MVVLLICLRLQAYISDVVEIEIHVHVYVFNSEREKNWKCTDTHP